MSKREINLRGKVELKKAIAYLEDIVTSLKSGTLCVQDDEQAVTLKPGKCLELEIEATQKGSKEGLRVEMAWRTQGAAEKEKELALKISSQEPQEDAEQE